MHMYILLWEYNTKWYILYKKGINKKCLFWREFSFEYSILVSNDTDLPRTLTHCYLHQRHPVSQIQGMSLYSPSYSEMMWMYQDRVSQFLRYVKHKSSVIFPSSFISKIIHLSTRRKTTPCILHPDLHNDTSTRVFLLHRSRLYHPSNRHREGLWENSEICMDLSGLQYPQR